jgi:hypothetical protein
VATKRAPESREDAKVAGQGPRRWLGSLPVIPCIALVIFSELLLCWIVDAFARSCESRWW